MSGGAAARAYVVGLEQLGPLVPPSLHIVAQGRKLYLRIRLIGQSYIHRGHYHV